MVTNCNDQSTTLVFRCKNTKRIKNSKWYNYLLFVAPRQDKWNNIQHTLDRVQWIKMSQFGFYSQSSMVTTLQLRFYLTCYLSWVIVYQDWMLCLTDKEFGASSQTENIRYFCCNERHNSMIYLYHDKHAKCQSYTTKNGQTCRERWFHSKRQNWQF